MPTPLERKLVENRERRERAQLLGALPPSLAARIETAEFIYSAEKDFRKGFILDQYVGYLPAGRSTNSNEIVYEVVCFSG